MASGAAASTVLLRGTALHAGGPAEVRITRAPGPVVWVQRGVEVRLEELAATRTDRGVLVASRDGRVAIDLAEHLLAALGGMGVRRGVRIETDSDELPLLDGGARLFCEALFAVRAACGEKASLVVAAPGVLEHGASVYRFAPPEVDASAPGAARARVRVEVSFPPPVGHEEAAWDGDPGDFFARIAPARTFGWAHEHAALVAASRARAVDLTSVIVFGPDGVIQGCRPSTPGEIARHKLLDLVGDFALYGGPPLGLVEAKAPGHTATHAIVAEALRMGILARVERDTADRDAEDRAARGADANAGENEHENENERT